MTEKRTSPLITILTDFGEEDWFVAAMKGVIASISPESPTIDITHRVPPGDIRRGALVLRCAYRSFPPGTVHLAVVDPGVGTDRGVLAARAGEHLFVAPDNGLLSWVLREERETAVFRANREDLFLPRPSTTFHGRDIFAPLAARLAAGFPLAETGPHLDHPVIFPPPLLRARGENRWEAEIIGRDRFGNCLTSLTREAGGEGKADVLLISIGGRNLRFPLADCFGSVSAGRPLAVWGSCGFLELAVNGGDAGRELGLEAGEKFTARWTEL
jgi:S-adenosyl-L-methionine hydrolase (adenosine-forming)